MLQTHRPSVIQSSFSWAMIWRTNAWMNDNWLTYLLSVCYFHPALRCKFHMLIIRLPCSCILLTWKYVKVAECLAEHFSIQVRGNFLSEPGFRNIWVFLKYICFSSIFQPVQGLSPSSPLPAVCLFPVLQHTLFKNIKTWHQKGWSQGTSFAMPNICCKQLNQSVSCTSLAAVIASCDALYWSSLRAHSQPFIC